MTGKPPLVDYGNYPTIFADEIADIVELSAGELLAISLVETRRNAEGNLERVIVARLIRPTRSVAQLIEKFTAAAKHDTDEAQLAVMRSPTGVQ